jgi:hypothetical protein
MATNSELLFISWVANLTEGHLPTGKPSRKCESLDPGQLDIPLFVKNPAFNMLSENCEEKFSKSEQFSSRPLSACSYGNIGVKFRKKLRLRSEIRTNWSCGDWVGI